MKRLLLTLSVLAMSLMTLPAPAQVSPLLIPEPVSETVYSPNRHYFAVIQPRLPKISVYKFNYGQDEPQRQWFMFSKFKHVALADDGEHLVVSQGNIIPAQYKGDTIVLSFFKKGEAIAHVPLKLVVKDYSKLIKTKRGQYVWGYYRGFEQDGSYTIESVDGWVLSFDPASGRLTRRYKKR